MKSTTRMIAAAVAFSSCAAAALAVTPASAMPSVKHGVTLESPLVQQAGYKWNKWKKRHHCHYVKKARWHHGHRVVRYVKVCR
jgi:hypothetical protein